MYHEAITKNQENVSVTGKIKKVCYRIGGIAHALDGLVVDIQTECNALVKGFLGLFGRIQIHHICEE